MRSGTTIAQAFWRALSLELPASRRSQGARFFADLRPLQRVESASVLRAFARTLVETDRVPVGKDAHYDPVELIAAALEVSIESWDNIARTPTAGEWAAFWFDVAQRVAAFEALFRCRLHDEKWPIVVSAVAAAIEATACTHSEVGGLFERARSAVSKIGSTVTSHRDALLAEIVVLGSRSQITSTGEIGCRARALPFAHAMCLVRTGRISEALAILEMILVPVPGHRLALEQAARCYDMLGDMIKARAYSKRASRPARANTWRAVRSHRASSSTR